MFFFSSRSIMPCIPSMPAAPMNWASQPISGCGSWSSRTWTATASGGWGRQKVDKDTCHPTTSANQSTHERSVIWRMMHGRWELCEHRRNKRKRKHLDMLWLFLELSSWSLIVRETDLCCKRCSWENLYAYIYTSFFYILFLLTGSCTFLFLGKKNTC